VEATCVNDQRLIQYSLSIDLYDKVAPFAKDVSNEEERLELMSEYQKDVANHRDRI
jgi:hypothetical protein